MPQIPCIDSHAHLTNETLYPDIDNILARAQEAGVVAIMNICTDKVTLERGIALAKKYPWVYNVASTTPHDVEKEGEELFPLMAAHARQGLLKAVGETGLDYHYTHSKKEIQHDFLRRYLRLARETKLPVVIHCREAFADFFRILDEEYVSNGKHGPGVLHCFTGTAQEAQEVVARGWYVSYSGIATFKKSQELRDTLPYVPLEQLLIETDAPYLAPQSHRGKTNEPAFIQETANTVAMVKGVPLEQVLEITTANAKKLFRL